MNDPGHALQCGREPIAVSHILDGTIAQVEPTNRDPFVLEPRAKIPADQTGRPRHQNHRLPCQVTRPNHLEARRGQLFPLQLFPLQLGGWLTSAGNLDDVSDESN